MFEPDFERIRRLLTVVEIKRPSHKLFVKKGKFSGSLRVGIRQVEEAFKIIKEKPQEAAKLGIHPSDDISGMVLIGRHSDLKNGELTNLEEVNEKSAQIKIVPFDTLIENIETVKGFYGVKGRAPTVVVGQKGTIDEDITLRPGETLQKAIDYLTKRIERGQ